MMVEDDDFVSFLPYCVFFHFFLFCNGQASS
jgi:hypothetical protein